MDLVGNEDAVRYALERAMRVHTKEGGSPDWLPSSNVAREFLKELEERGWALEKEDPDPSPAETAEAEARLSVLKSHLQQAADILDSVGDSMYGDGATFMSGMIAAALMIVEEIVSWIEERQPSGEEPS